MNDLTHAVGFIQNAYTIILALALGEAFKQFVLDGADKKIQWRRLPLLAAFLFMIFPFFHGMSRYFFVMYLAPKPQPEHFAGSLMLDGVVFMLMAACFFVLSRSLSPENWKRFYCTLGLLLIVDSIWVCTVFYRNVPVMPWLILDVILATVLLLTFALYRQSVRSLAPPIICAATIFATTVTSYVWMRDFYFPP